MEGPDFMDCVKCHGTGKIEKPVDMQTKAMVDCEYCEGTGKIPDDNDVLSNKLDWIISGQEEIRGILRYLPRLTRSIYYEPRYQGYMVNKVKEPFKRALLLWGKGRVAKVQALKELWGVYRAVRRLPEPTRYNVGQPNSRILVDIRDYFFAHIKDVPFLKELRWVVNLVIIIYDTDFYRPFINVWADELRKSDWQANGPLEPDGHYWNREKLP